MPAPLKGCSFRSAFHVGTSGIFGTDTKNALVHAQGKEGIGTDGGYGKETRTNITWPFQRSASGRWSCFHITNW
ncbi:hypothetical protein [Streptomyces sp. NBC_00059]|uniref:hypothetical protein n=1 Tax=Streptomyces sp. NBC_00059 TaxID=2975635 RepID=UPI002255E031|nr:hypothetical protein [Streptomyces sp. NBC_00059]MCX5417597.1 hypothetical protein [Streptomyces sp. NBC_00059]